jgi:CheY-like chemotaxis protein
MAMPRMDGQAVIRALREINPQVCIVANSGFFPDSSRSQSSVQKVVGADKFLVKPFTAISLLTTLHDLLKGAPQDSSKATGCS